VPGVNGGRRLRSRGNIERLPNGGLRVRVYAGVDPVTGRRHDLREIIPAGTNAAAEAEKARVRLLNQVDERRHPRTAATVAQLLERYLSEPRVARKTLHTYRGYVDKHVLPFLGELKVGQVDADVLDSLYAELQRCRDHCDGKAGRVDHRTRRAHVCDARCPPHTCRPLAEWTVRKIHWVLSGAFRRAQRWNWVATNPMTMASPPTVKPPNPKPPTPQEAARIVEEAWKDPDWGTLVWLTMITGLRRGELCAIRWRDLDLADGVLHLERRIGQIGSQLWEEQSTKTHADRRVVLDPETVEVLVEHRRRCEVRTQALGVELSPDAFAFSLAPDGHNPRRPESVTQRYRKMCRRIGIETTLHKLRHYSATELILAGVDIRTVAGRLGHGGGGATTLRTYAAWISEGDQRAAKEIAARMPPRPASRPNIVEIDEKHAYQRIAVALRDQVLDGTPLPGLPIPTIKELATTYSVSVPTAKRAVDLLAEWGFVHVTPGQRTLVRRLPPDLRGLETVSIEDHRRSGSAPPAIPASRDAALLDLEVRRLGQTAHRVRCTANPNDAATLHRLLVDAVRRDGGKPRDIGDYELVVRRAGEAEVVTTFVAAAP
jgi:integrase/DNA-binding transcriptional regulator YhcF (GntR family)